MDFETWYGNYVVSLRARGYTGPIDKDEALKIFNEGQNAADSAGTFVEELKK